MINNKIKVLIGTPIIDKKMYSWTKYVDAIKSLTPVKDVMAHVLVVDTSDELDKLDEEVILEQFNYNYVKEIKTMDKVVSARNSISNYAFLYDYNFILFIDSDVIVPPDTLSKLLSHVTNDTTIYSGFYPIFDKYGFPIPCAKIIKNNIIMDIPEELLKDILEVDIIGLGCCLIPREIFTKVKFRCVRDKKGKLIQSEDMCFCEDVKKNGYKLLYDFNLVAKHIIQGDHWDKDTA